MKHFARCRRPTAQPEPDAPPGRADKPHAGNRQHRPRFRLRDVERMSSFFHRALVVLLAALLCQGAAGQYPSRPIRLLVPIPPGGGPDIVARLIAPKLGDALGQPVVVENRVGGNGNLAGELVAKSNADGYTLLLGMDSLLVINP